MKNKIKFDNDIFENTEYKIKNRDEYIRHLINAILNNKRKKIQYLIKFKDMIIKYGLIVEQRRKNVE